jgi:hypothetical protein
LRKIREKGRRIVLNDYVSRSSVTTINPCQGDLVSSPCAGSIYLPRARTRTEERKESSLGTDVDRILPVGYLVELASEEDECCCKNGRPHRPFASDKFLPKAREYIGLLGAFCTGIVSFIAFIVCICHGFEAGQWRSFIIGGWRIDFPVYLFLDSASEYIIGTILGR